MNFRDFVPVPGHRIRIPRLRFLLPALCLFLLGISGPLTAHPGRNQEPVPLDIVFCADLSGSTNGLLDNIRENLWGIINLAQSFEPTVKLRIGFVGYSRPSFGRSNFYVKTFSKLTDDFDHLVSDLNKLKSGIEKGDQYVSNALEAAGLQMNWARSSRSIKILFLIGNGNVDTGSSDYRTVTDEINDDGVSLLPIYCLRVKPLSEELGWELIGRIAGNNYQTIWATKQEPFYEPGNGVDTLQTLIASLNNTIIPYTKEGNVALEELKNCDQQAAFYLPPHYENRAYYRVSPWCLDRIASWDLVSDTTITPNRIPVMDYNTAVADNIRLMDANTFYKTILERRQERDRLISEIRKWLPESRQENLIALLKGDAVTNGDILERVVLRFIIKKAASQEVFLPGTGAYTSQPVKK